MFVHTDEFVWAAYKAHSDLVDFVELGHIFDFDNWLLPMRNRLEEGISVCVCVFFFSFYLTCNVFFFYLTNHIILFLSDTHGD